MTNEQLPFLDLLLRREEDGFISTSVYRKPTNTDRYLDFSSHHPQAHKAAVVCTLMTRAKVLPSSVLARTDEEVQVTAALQSSGYPLRFIRNSSTPTARVPIANETHTSSITLPYIKGVSEAIRRILAPLCVRTMQFQTSPHPTQGLSACVGLHSPRAEIWCSLPHPLFRVPQGIHWPDW